MERGVFIQKKVRTALKLLSGREEIGVAEILFDQKDKPDADKFTQFLTSLAKEEQKTFLILMQGFQLANSLNKGSNKAQKDSA